MDHQKEKEKKKKKMMLALKVCRKVPKTYPSENKQKTSTPLKKKSDWPLRKPVYGW